MAAFVALCLQAVVACWRDGLWEDGYFFLRYARNTWVHGVMAWNVADGPVHGMTSQLYQLLVISVYPLIPHHLVTASKLAGAASLVGAAVALTRVRWGERDVAGRAALALVTLGMPLVVRHLGTGLESCTVLLWLAVWLARFRRPGGAGAVEMALFVVGTYLLRPDAVLIPLVAIAAGLRSPPARKSALATIALASVGIAACLVALKLYYGTALPLSFYVKSYALTSAPPEFLSIFWREKLKNAAQLGVLTAPLVAVAAIGRQARALLVAAAAFAGYHLIATVEVMGHHSRFYLPALVPLAGAAMASWSPFLARATRRPALTVALAVAWVAAFLLWKRADAQSGVFIYIPLAEELPPVLALALVIAVSAARPRWADRAALVAMALLLAGGALRLGASPPSSLALEDDETLLRRQIAPRATFRGLGPLTAIAPRGVYHTDMGAPGVLFPEAKVTDLDGILNEELTLAHTPFQTLCARDRPDAIFMPNFAYPRLREEIARAPCFADYVPVAGTQLYLRRDRLADYQRAAGQ